MDFLTCLLIDCGKKTKNNLSKALAEYNLTCRQAIIIKILDDESITAKEIGEKSSIDKATLSAMLKKLEEHEMITHCTGEKDKREKVYSLTDKGSEMLPKVLEVDSRFQKKLFNKLSVEEYEKLTKYLLLIKDNL